MFKSVSVTILNWTEMLWSEFPNSHVYPDSKSCPKVLFITVDDIPELPIYTDSHQPSTHSGQHSTWSVESQVNVMYKIL